MPSRVERHTFAHVAGEAEGLAGRGYGAAASLAGQPGSLGQHRFLGRADAGRRGVKAVRQPTAEGGDTPVTVNAGDRSSRQPEAAADHLAPSRRVPLPASSPRSTTRPGSAFLGPPRLLPRRRLTAWRTP